jgi:hypothetical protein
MVRIQIQQTSEGSNGFPRSGQLAWIRRYRFERGADRQWFTVAIGNHAATGIHMHGA